MKKKKRFLLFLVLVFILSACGTKGKDAPKEEKEQVEDTQGEDKQEGNTQEKNTQEESKLEETKPEENDSQTEADPSNNNEADTPKPDPGTPDPELSSRPLEFFRGAFQDGEGFTFDGFTITADYDIMEKRLALTEQQPEIKVTDNGATTNLIFYEVVMEEEPEVVGNFTYMFYKNQFLRGTMSILFPDFEAAKDFIWGIEEELDPVRIPISELEQKMEEGSYEGYAVQDLREPEEWEVPTCSAGYADRRGISVQTSAVKRIERGGKEVGVVTIFFIENVPGGGAVKNNSQYFDFDFGEEQESE